MAKKLRFTGMNNDIMTMINHVLEVRFVRIEACADIRKSLKKLEVEIEDLTKDITGLDPKDPKYIEGQTKIRAKMAEERKLEERRKAIMQYSNAYLKDAKSGKVRIPGAYSKLLDIDGIGMYGYYQEAVDRESINDTKGSIGYKTAVCQLMDKWGLADAPDTLKAKFANIVCLKSMGVQTASASKIVKGELLAYKSALKFQETLVDIMVDYMNRKGGVEVVVPNKAEYDYKVAYGENQGKVTIEAFEMVSK